MIKRNLFTVLLVIQLWRKYMRSWWVIARKTCLQSYIFLALTHRYEKWYLTLDIDFIHTFFRILALHQFYLSRTSSLLRLLTYMSNYCISRGPFYKHGFTSIPTWISNYIHYKMWNEITYPLPNFNGCTIEVWEWITNFISYFTGHVIVYPCWN